MIDPVSLIQIALATGAAAGVKDTASSVVKDAYEALKTKVKDRFAGELDAELVLAEDEAAPDVWEEPLVSKLTTVGVNEGLVTAAQRLMHLVDAAGSQAGKYDVDFGTAKAFR